ncbi:MAG: hypothetical protein LV481_03985 [Methylacidiphilales bacterium]|nr:hypothetical protein [Candidatus Methylacidiphilales bacterium]
MRNFIFRLTQKDALILLAFTFALSLSGLVYQVRMRRSWWDVPFMLFNLAFVILGGLVLTLDLLGIDFMPRQL